MNKAFKDIRAVVFDMAGTTIDEGDIVYQSVKNALRLFGFEFSLDQVTLEIGGMSKREGIEKLLNEYYPGRSSEILVAKIFNAFIHGLEERYTTDTSIVEMPGASALFTWLKSEGIKVALNTGYSRSTVDILVNRMNWSQKNLIDFTIASDEVERGRPEPFMINEITSVFEIEPANIAKVGDTISDINEGHNAGCAVVVGITSPKYDRDALLGIGATHTIEHLSELKALF
ncbi:MAG: HAD hydrolase-like protein [Bacteroidota bacterium]